MNFRDKLMNSWQAGIPVISIQTTEITRCVNEIVDTVNTFNRKLSDFENASEHLRINGLTVYFWNAVGWSQLLPETEKKKISTVREYITPTSCLRLPLADNSVPTVFIYQNMHLYWKTASYPNIASDILEIVRKRKSYTYVVLLGAGGPIPEEISPYITTVPFSLPTREDFEELITKFQPILESKLTKENIREVADALSGLTIYEAEIVLRTGIAQEKGKRIDCTYIFQEKANSVRKSGLLEYMPYGSDTLDDIGGAIALKQWIKKTATIFHNRSAAEDYGLPVPRGMLLCGISGTGKSLTARTVARVYNLPLYRLDFGKLFEGLVGSTERNTRELFKLIDAVSPAVFYIDEMEKSLAGAESSSQLDAGVTARVVGAFLTFMQEKTCPAFFVATANSVNRLVPELLRRFNGVWFIDLPTDAERTEIFNIWIRKTGRDPKKYDIKKLVSKTVDYTGAEIQNAIEEAMYTAFYRGEEYTTKDIIAAIDTLPKLAETKSEEIRALREWARGRARVANVEEGKKPAWWDSSDLLLDKHEVHCKAG